MDNNTPKEEEIKTNDNSIQGNSNEVKNDKDKKVSHSEFEMNSAENHFEEKPIENQTER